MYQLSEEDRQAIRSSSIEGYVKLGSGVETRIERAVGGRRLLLGELASFVSVGSVISSAVMLHIERQRQEFIRRNGSEFGETVVSSGACVLHKNVLATEILADSPAVAACA